jgi:hypothetical protein
MRRPVPPIVIHLPNAAAHGVVRVPVGVKASRDMHDIRTIEQCLDLFGCIDEDIRTMDEDAWAIAAVWNSKLARLNTDAAVTAWPGGCDATTGSEKFNLHEGTPPE